MFDAFKRAVQKQFEVMSTTQLYVTTAEKDKMWDTYLDSFPAGTNPMFRQRTEHDCNCCKQFIRAAGNVVAIINGELVSIWDVNVGGHYQVVADALSKLVKSKPIDTMFFHYANTVGTDKNYEEGFVWEHFYLRLPSNAVGTVDTEVKTTKQMLQRALSELTEEAISITLDLIDQGSLYKGDEFRPIVAAYSELLAAHRDAHNKEFFYWQNVGSFAARIRNTAICSLLVDLSAGMDIEAAVRAYEFKVAPTNYKRLVAVATPAMKAKAMKELEELGLSYAHRRRYAVLDDIHITDVKFADRSIRSKLIGGGMLDDLPVKQNFNFDRIGEVSIDCFLERILPNVDSVELFVENRHMQNMVSLIAPIEKSDARFFKWDNLFSWAYTGEVTDSVKARVKKAGGTVDGDLRISLSWFNTDDLDLHVLEPGGYEIYFRNKGLPSPSSGRLDVDMNAHELVRDPVENVIYLDKRRMREGTYAVQVNNYCKRDTRDVGFVLEVEYDGVIQTFTYDKPVQDGKTVAAVNIQYKDGEFSVYSQLVTNKVQPAIDFWNIRSQEFHRVRVVTMSPNYWGNNSVGNRHVFFMLEDCVNPGQARGFFNEFLRSELDKHRKVLELAGSKLQVAEAKDQLSGLGFSSTQRNSIVCRVKGSFTRDIKIVF